MNSNILEEKNHETGKDIFQALKRSELFLGLEDDELWQIAMLSSCTMETYKKGEVIFEQGHHSENLYILDQGQVDLEMETVRAPNQSGNRLVVDIITKGGIFGWSALVPPYIFTKHAIAAETSRVVSINGQELSNLLDSNPQLGYKVMKGFSHVIAWRLRDLQRVMTGGKRSPVF